MYPRLAVDDCQSYFSTTFDQARTQWLALADKACAQNLAQARRADFCVQHSYPHPLTGPHGEALATDCLWLGSPQAEQVIVVVSATHGIEGYAGSAIQHMLLEQLLNKEISLPPEIAFLFVHALTPWGFAWYRRCDEQGIDLNRHFINFEQGLPDNPDYAKVRPWLFEPDASKRKEQLANLAIELGRRDYEMALSGGQYVDAAGPFYGGRRPNHGRQLTRDLFKRFELSVRDLIVLDLHTGLGPWGYGELICDHAPGSAGVQTARGLFGGNITETALGTSTSVPKTGLADFAWHAIMNDRSCYLTLEYGSYSVDDLFDCLIEDHQFWAAYQPQAFDDKIWMAHRKRLLEHFCPADKWWRQSVLVRASQLVQQALTGLQP